MRINPPSKAHLRVATLTILIVMCTLAILSAVFPFPGGTQWDFLSIGTSEKAYANPDWLSGWDYRIAVNITGQSGAGTNYQVQFIIDADTGGSGDFDLAGHCTDFPNDITFTDNDETTELDYWVESYTDASPDTATVWVEVADDLSSGTITIYCYYGKSGQESLSDGNSTFQFFDDDWTDFGGSPSSTLLHTADGSNHIWGAGGVQLPNGNLIVAWEHNTAESDNNGKIQYSIYSGSWSAAATLVDTASIRDTEPQFITIGSTVWFFYTGIDEDGGNRPSTIYYRTSSDNGTSWSGATSLASSSALLVTIQNPIICDSGRIVLPVWYKGASYYSASCYYSDDDGSSWDRGGNITEQSSYYNEPTIIEKDNGDLLMFLRYNGGLYQYKATSSDEGESWSAVASSGYQSPRAQSVLFKLTGDNVAFLHNDVSSATNTPRVPLTISLSDDDAATFDYSVDIRSGTGQWNNMGLFQKSNGNICAVYTDEANWRIYICELTEDQIMGVESAYWTTVGNPASSVNSGIATITSNSLDDYFKSTTYTANQNVALRFREADKTAQAYPGYVGFGHYDGLAPYNDYCVLKVPYTLDQNCIVTEDNTGRAVSSGWNDDDDFHIFELTWVAATCHLYQDDVDKGSTSTYIPNTALHVAMGYVRGDGTWNTNEFDIDWILVRKFVATEPAFAAAGSEEAFTVEITNTPSSNAFGVLQVNTSDSTAIDYFTLENTGSGAVDVAIYGTDLTGGDDTWDLSDTATPGENIYGLLAGIDTATDWPDDNFEWGSDEDPLSDSGGEITWTVSTPGSCKAEIDTSQYYSGTRSGRLYRDGVTHTYAQFSHTAAEGYSINFMARKDDGSTLNMMHGDASYRIEVVLRYDESVFYNDGALQDTGADVVINTWHSLSIQNIDWTAHTYDIYLDDALIQRAAGMRNVASPTDIIRIYNSAGTSELWIDDVELDDDFSTIVKEEGSTPYNYLVEDLAEDATQDWGLKLYMPTSLSGYDAQQMSATITLVASEA